MLFTLRPHLLALVLVACTAGGLSPGVDRSALGTEEIDPAAGTPCEQTVEADPEGRIDCRGTCVPLTWIGDGTCDDGADGAYLACEPLGFDNGDCDEPPTAPAPTDEPTPSDPPSPTDEPTPTEPPPTVPPDPNAPGADCSIAGQAGVRDCDAQCVPVAWSTDDNCDDGSNGPNLMCAELGFDNGACGGTTPPTVPPNPGGPPIGNPCTTGAGQNGTIDCAYTCQPLSRRDDGVCDDGTSGPNFMCAQHNLDGGDCDPNQPPPTPPTPPTPPRVPGDSCSYLFIFSGVVDCNGNCENATYLGDNICDPNLVCLGNDLGDC